MNKEVTVNKLLEAIQESKRSSVESIEYCVLNPAIVLQIWLAMRESKNNLYCIITLHFK